MKSKFLALHLHSGPHAFDHYIILTSKKYVLKSKDMQFLAFPEKAGATLQAIIMPLTRDLLCISLEEEKKKKRRNILLRVLILISWMGNVKVATRWLQFQTCSDSGSSRWLPNSIVPTHRRKSQVQRRPFFYEKATLML